MHDQGRAVSRFGCTVSPEARIRSAQMLALCLNFLQGTPYMYQGEELGMTNGSVETLDDCNDIEIHNAYRELVSVFHFYKKLIALRKQYPVIISGSYELLLPDDCRVYAYRRRLDEDTLLIVYNFTGALVNIENPESLPELSVPPLITNYPGHPVPHTLRPWEARAHWHTKYRSELP
jgi:oligo-1,6-glucosidase